MLEYDRLVIKCKSPEELIIELNRLGQNNWEIIYYNEVEPIKFGDEWICTILVKKTNTKIL